MENLNERAANYAAEKVNELLAKAIAQAYADGYRDGYKDRDERISSSNSDSNLKFVDLGLPSGTKWSIGLIANPNAIKPPIVFISLPFLPLFCMYLFFRSRTKCAFTKQIIWRNCGVRFCPCFN